MQPESGVDRAGADSAGADSLREDDASAGDGAEVDSSPEGKSLDRDGASSLAEAAAELDAAEQRIAGLFGGLGDDDAAPAPAVPKDDKSGERAPATGDEARPEANAGLAANRCTTACRALESMQRSAERLCELTGGDDGRCDDANTRVTRAARVVADACPTCHAAAP
jgi:hypothetical protein